MGNEKSENVFFRMDECPESICENLRLYTPRFITTGGMLKLAVTTGSGVEEKSYSVCASS